MAVRWICPCGKRMSIKSNKIISGGPNRVREYGLLCGFCGKETTVKQKEGRLVPDCPICGKLSLCRDTTDGYFRCAEGHIWFSDMKIKSYKVGEDGRITRY